MEGNQLWWRQVVSEAPEEKWGSRWRRLSRRRTDEQVPICFHYAALNWSFLLQKKLNFRDRNILYSDTCESALYNNRQTSPCLWYFGELSPVKLPEILVLVLLLTQMQLAIIFGSLSIVFWSICSFSIHLWSVFVTFNQFVVSSSQIMVASGHFLVVFYSLPIVSGDSFI